MAGNFNEEMQKVGLNLVDKTSNPNVPIAGAIILGSLALKYGLESIAGAIGRLNQKGPDNAARTP